MWEDIRVFKQLWDSASWKEKIFWGLVAALTVLRIALFLSIPIEALGNAIHDDRLQMNQACYLFQGNWLGAYSNTTLVKGISFPLFLAFLTLSCAFLCSSSTLICEYCMLAVQYFAIVYTSNLNKSISSFVSSSVIHFSWPEARMEFASSCLDSMSLSIFSSIVPFETSLWTKTSLVCPIR